MKKILLILLFISYGKCFSQSCSSVNKKVDKFTGKVTYMSPVISPSHSATPSIVFLKDDSTIFLSLSGVGSSLRVSKKGVYILFDNGEKINREDVTIDVKPNENSGWWTYSAIFKLSNKEIELFKKYLLTDFRLYLFDESLNENLSKEVMFYANCISESK